MLFNVRGTHSRLPLTYVRRVHSCDGWATSAADVLDQFTGIEVRSVLRNLNLDVHKLLNALSAEANAHIVFDRLGVWPAPALVRPFVSHTCGGSGGGGITSTKDVLSCVRVQDSRGTSLRTPIASPRRTPQ